ncbi:ATP-dependent helicase HrpB [Paenibacillus sp. HJGM_3]|uniref:ATP-dependent helicase HrpB n=1 Tax=Paenibacillus sp. HJGM_3 TaxID=3379816 RepID=UPI00385E94A0
MQSSFDFPIDQVIDQLKGALEFRMNAVLAAPPGAGKTTRVPLALLQEPWARNKRILLLEPRRIAARSAARFMARQLGEPVGQTVGYRMRYDTRVGPATRIEVITEGVLTRLLQEDPALEDVAIVLFDEFHERSLQADLGLALCLQAQSLFRPELRLLVMSATLDTERIAKLLDDAPVVSSEGRNFPVEIRHAASRRRDDRWETQAARTIAEALAQEAGDVLVFLPGLGEIRRVSRLLAGLRLGPGVRLSPLHGSLTPEEQDQAIAPSAPGTRKVVLATSIAETSLTVEGVRTVVDCGFSRVPRFSPRTGLTRLETVPVTLDSAVQRSGRAGRVAPGVCYRLWTPEEERQLAAHGVPEIAAADLAPLALELAAWGAADPAELRWLDPPPAAAYRQARELLAQLGALDAAGAMTPYGRRMAALGLPPRLAHMLLQAEGIGLQQLACELAALLGERDPLRASGAAAGSASAGADADVRLRVEALRAAPRGGGAGASASAGAGDPTVWRRIAEEAARLARTLAGAAHGGGAAEPAAAGSRPADGPGAGAAPRASDLAACGVLLAFAYPDRIAQRRPDGRFLLRSGRGAAFAHVQPLSQADYIVAVDLEDQGADGRINLAAALEPADLERYLQGSIERETSVEWDREALSVKARKRTRLGAIVLQDVPDPKPDPGAVTTALLSGIEVEGLDMLPWSRPARQLQERLVFLHRLNPAWADRSEAHLLQTLEEWLAPYVDGMKSRADLQRLNLVSILLDALSWNERRELDEEAPTHYTVPSGSRVPIDYSDPEAPAIAVRLQEMFGLMETPRLGWGRVPLTLHLLSPASRPVQVTRDLANFWRETYFDIKKDLKGRYPKHYWPEDPFQAVPTNRVRPRP